jgi:hypothetical protein
MSFAWLNEIVIKRKVFGKMFIVCMNERTTAEAFLLHSS